MKAMVLSAGYGTRLGDLTRNQPKPMLLIQNRPLLEYLIVNLARSGFRQIAINLHFMPEVIRDYFGSGQRWGVEITYSFENELLGTAGGVKNLESFFREEEAFLVHYGDVLTDQDFSSIYAYHLEQHAEITMLLHQRTKSNSIVSLDEKNRVIGFLERPSDEERKGVRSPWVNSGISICNASILDAIPAGLVCDFPRDIFPKFIENGKVFGFPLSGYRCAIDSPERLAEARQAITDGRCKISLPM